MNPPTGLCTGYRQDLWTSNRSTDRALARAICASCPSAAPCAEYARALEGSRAWAYGIYGGLDEDERHGTVKRSRAGWRQRRAA